MLSAATLSPTKYRPWASAMLKLCVLVFHLLPDTVCTLLNGKGLAPDDVDDERSTKTRPSPTTKYGINSNKLESNLLLYNMALGQYD